MARQTRVEQSDIDGFVKLRADGLTHRQIADRTGWSEERVSFHLRKAGVNDAPKYNRAQVLEAYRASRPIENDDRKHLEAVISEGGFTWKVLSA